MRLPPTRPGCRLRDRTAASPGAARGREGVTPAAMPASARRAFQEDDRAGETIRIIARHLLHSTRDRGEVVGAKRRRDEHDASVLAIRGNELSSRLREIIDVACDDSSRSTTYSDGAARSRRSTTGSSRTPMVWSTPSTGRVGERARPVGRGRLAPDCSSTLGAV